RAVGTGGGVTIKLRKTMQDENAHPAGIEYRLLGNPLGPGTSVVIAPHGGHRRNPAELLQDRRITDIAGVDDVVAAPQSPDGLGSQQSMRIGYQAYAQHSRAPRGTSLRSPWR